MSIKKIALLATLGTVLAVAGVLVVKAKLNPERGDAAAPPSASPTTTGSASPLPSPSPSPSQSPSPTVTAVPPPPSRECPSAARATLSLHSRASGSFSVAHGDVWLIHADGRVVSRFDCRGRTVGTIAVQDLAPGLVASRYAAIDSTGIWLAGWTDPAQEVTGTRRTQRCAAVRRTGPDRRGFAVLLHINARTNCPSAVIDASEDQGPSGLPPEDYISGVGFVGGELFVTVREEMHRINPRTGSMALVRAGYRDLIGAYGSVWSAAGGGPHGDLGRLYRTEPRSGQVAAEFQINGPRCVAGGETVWCSSGRFNSEAPPRGTVAWIEAATNRTGWLDLDDRDEENVECVGMAWHADRFYCGWGDNNRRPRDTNEVVRVADPKTGRVLGSIGADSRIGVRSMVVHGSTLWIATAPDNQILWVDLTKARLAPAS